MEPYEELLGRRGCDNHVMEPIGDARARRIEELREHVIREFWDEAGRRANTTVEALLADASDPSSPTGFRSCSVAMDVAGLGAPRRAWRKELRAEERRLEELGEKLWGPASS